MYKDKTLDKNGYISDVHAMDYSEALAITGSTDTTTGLINTGAYYWLASATTSLSRYVLFVSNSGGIGNFDSGCWGVRPVVSLTSGVYIKSGSGTEADPYILGKD